MKLSDHFSLWEFTKSQTAERNNIRNKPGEEEIRNLEELCEKVLEPVRRHYDRPFSPSSGYRSPALNMILGSSRSSQHITGQAVDFEVPGIPNIDVARWIIDKLAYDQLILEFYREDEPHSGWIHCSYVGENNRNQARRFDGRTWSNLS